MLLLKTLQADLGGWWCCWTQNSSSWSGGLMILLNAKLFKLIGGWWYYWAQNSSSWDLRLGWLSKYQKEEEFNIPCNKKNLQVSKSRAIWNNKNSNKIRICLTRSKNAYYQWLRVLAKHKSKERCQPLGSIAAKGKICEHLKYLISQSVESSTLKRLETFMSLNIFSPQK
jgi:hypothetical protein